MCYKEGERVLLWPIQVEWTSSGHKVCSTDTSNIVQLDEILTQFKYNLGVGCVMIQKKYRVENQYCIKCGEQKNMGPTPVCFRPDIFHGQSLCYKRKHIYPMEDVTWPSSI